MTTATKTRQTKTREEQLAEEIARHRAQVAELEAQASAWESDAAKIEARVEREITSFTGAVGTLPAGIDQDRAAASLKRQGAADLRKRASAYAETVNLGLLEAEYAHLRNERETTEARAEASEDAQLLIAELEMRSGWLFSDTLARRATEFRVQQIVDDLVAIRNDHRIAIDLNGYTRLPGLCIEAAGQRLQVNGRAAADDYLPDVAEVPDRLLALPDDFQRPGGVADQASVQGARKAFDPTLPKDHEIRAAAASVPAVRNDDGTIAGGSYRNPFETTTGMTVPRARTEAEERAARRFVATQIAAEDEALEERGA
jgi:hypothetical protein